MHKQTIRPKEKLSLKEVFELFPDVLASCPQNQQNFFRDVVCVSISSVIAGDYFVTKVLYKPALGKALIDVTSLDKSIVTIRIFKAMGVLLSVTSPEPVVESMVELGCFRPLLALLEHTDEEVRMASSECLKSILLGRRGNDAADKPHQDAAGIQSLDGFTAMAKAFGNVPKEGSAPFKENLVVSALVAHKVSPLPDAFGGFLDIAKNMVTNKQNGMENRKRMLIALKWLSWHPNNIQILNQHNIHKLAIDIINGDEEPFHLLAGNILTYLYSRSDQEFRKSFTPLLPSERIKQLSESQASQMQTEMGNLYWHLKTPEATFRACEKLIQIVLTRIQPEKSQELLPHTSVEFIESLLSSYVEKLSALQEDAKLPLLSDDLLGQILDVFDTCPPDVRVKVRNLLCLLQLEFLYNDKRTTDFWSERMADECVKMLSISQDVIETIHVRAWNSLTVGETSQRTTILIEKKILSRLVPLIASTDKAMVSITTLILSNLMASGQNHHPVNKPHPFREELMALDAYKILFNQYEQFKEVSRIARRIVQSIFRLYLALPLPSECSQMVVFTSNFLENKEEPDASKSFLVSAITSLLSCAENHALILDNNIDKLVSKLLSIKDKTVMDFLHFFAAFMRTGNEATKARLKTLFKKEQIIKIRDEFATDEEVKTAADNLLEFLR